MPSLSMTADRVISEKRQNQQINTTVCSTSPVTFSIYFGNSHLVPMNFDRETVMTNGGRWYTFELCRHQAIIADKELWKL